MDDVMGMNRIVLQEMKEAEAWRNFEKRMDRMGRVMGFKKCRTCGEPKPSTSQYWTQAKNPNRKYKWDSKCRECQKKPVKKPGRGEVLYHPINFEKEYDDAIVAYQTLIALAARMYHLLEIAKPYLDGVAWQVELIEKEWKEVIK